MTDTKQPSELETLKQRADDMGIKYSPNIGVDTLRTKVNDALQPKEKAKVVINPTTGSKYQDLVNEATKLIRVRVTNLNPNKKHSDGEFFRTGNSVISTISRFVPFESDTHVEQMLLNLINNRKYATVREEKTPDGKKPVRSLRKEFQVEVLPALTKKELEELATEQSKRQSV